MIVEDDSLPNKTLAYNLASGGYEVTGSLNARTAAAKLTACEYGLVLLDINLPDGNGYELCKLIKPNHPEALVIVLTAKDQASDQIQGCGVEAVDYIYQNNIRNGIPITIVTVLLQLCFSRGHFRPPEALIPTDAP